MLQAKLSSTKGFSNTTSGRLNDRAMKNQHKIIDLDDFEVQMLSPQFLLQKTLRKPMTEKEIHLKATNKNGFGQIISDEKYEAETSKMEKSRLNKNITNRSDGVQINEPQYKHINGLNLNIKPAYQNNNFIESTTISSNNEGSVITKDKNSIISAMLRKAEKPQIMKINVIQSVQKSTKKVEGPAEKKLKQMFGKQIAKTHNEKNNLVPKKKEKEQIEEQIGEQIAESIQEYGNQSFEKMSGAYESAIKQSIRESIGESSGLIKESIREDIPEMSHQSSYRQSFEQIKEQVPESLSGSMKKSSIGEQIEEQVYEEIFEQVSISDQLSKSKTSKFKKSKEQEDKFQLSVSASKGFRTKKSVVKSIKFAEQLNSDSKKVAIDKITDKISDKIKKDDKVGQELIKEHERINSLKEKVSKILWDNKKQNINPEDSNKNLLYQFKVEINRLITSQNFSSKLRKITGFLNGGISSATQHSISSLQNKIIENLTENLQFYRKQQIGHSQLDNLKSDYDKKLEVLLSNQEMKLRVQMDRKLHEKDLQYKKMIAELQQKFSQGVRYVGGEAEKPSSKISNLGKIEVESDYSIDSDQISWKEDLWELLPDFEKKKLYEKQSSQVANFLTDIMVKQIKEESLNRSGYDLSFQFPDDLNVSGSLDSSFPDFSRKKSSATQQEQFPMHSAFNREQLMKGIGQQKEQYFPPLNNITKPKTEVPVHLQFAPNKAQQKGENFQEKRDTTSVPEVIKILSKYKALYLKKKNDTIRKVIKTLQMKTKQSEPLSSYIADIKILYDKQISVNDLPYVRAYEQELVMELTAFYNKHRNRKYAFIEEEMRKLYDRFVVTCQVKTAEASVGSPNEIVPHENYIELKMNQQQKKLKDNIVNQIINILSEEFAREMPKRKK